MDEEKKIRRVFDELRRMQRAASDRTHEIENEGKRYSPSRKRAAMLRASLDLSEALIDLRKPRS